MRVLASARLTHWPMWGDSMSRRTVQGVVAV